MRELNPNLTVWLKTFNENVAQLIKNGFKATPTNAREGLANLTKNYISNIPAVAVVKDDYIAAPAYAIPVRIYHPNPGKELPVILYCHGGGHMAGSVVVYDPICRKLANKTEQIVVSVDYRLAPEFPYPIGLTDVYWAAKNVFNLLGSLKLSFKKSLSLVGDSGGAALIAEVAQKAQYDYTLNIDKQVLIYPSLDYTMTFPSIKENGNGYLLHKEKIAWYFDHYFSRGEDRYQASPLYRTVNKNLAACLLFTTEFCPLRDEGYAYVTKLESAQVKVKHVHFEDLIHTFVNLEDLVPESCEKLYADIAHFLNH